MLLSQINWSKMAPPVSVLHKLFQTFSHMSISKLHDKRNGQLHYIFRQKDNSKIWQRKCIHSKKPKNWRRQNIFWCHLPQAHLLLMRYWFLFWAKRIKKFLRKNKWWKDNLIKWYHSKLVRALEQMLHRSVGTPTTTKLYEIQLCHKTRVAMILHLKTHICADHTHNGSDFSVSRCRCPDTSNAAGGRERHWKGERKKEKREREKHREREREWERERNRERESERERELLWLVLKGLSY